MKLFSAFLFAVAILPAASQAALLSVGLGGNQETSGWGAPAGTALTSVNYPSYLPAGVPGQVWPAGTWAQPINSSYGSVSGGLHKLSGGFYAASQGLYSWSSSSGFAVRVADTSLSDVSTILFQTETARNPAGYYDPENPTVTPDPTYAFSAPTLYINGSLTGIAPSFSYFELSNGLVDFGGTSVELWNWAWQWDLSGVTEPIESYSVEWTQIVHASLVSIQIDASDAVNSTSVLPVPEPASSALLGVGIAGLFLRRRR